MLCTFGHRVAKCCEVLGVVGTNLTIFKLEPTTPNMSQHIATRWLNARNMLRPTMLRYVGLACCNRLAGALLVPRFETRYLKDSLAHRGVLWNMVTFKEHNIPHLSKKDLNHGIRSRDYVREFNFDAITASTVRRRDSDFIYN